MMLDAYEQHEVDLGLIFQLEEVMEAHRAEMEEDWTDELGEFAESLRMKREDDEVGLFGLPRSLPVFLPAVEGTAAGEEAPSYRDGELLRWFRASLSGLRDDTGRPVMGALRRVDAAVEVVVGLLRLRRLEKEWRSQELAEGVDADADHTRRFTERLDAARQDALRGYGPKWDDLDWETQAWLREELDVRSDKTVPSFAIRIRVSLEKHEVKGR